MEKSNIKIRIVDINDAESLLKIYAPYVEETAVTFEYEVPSIWEFKERIIKVKKKYPYLAAESGGKILGYAYAGAFHDRAAYDWAVETSIYVDKHFRKNGIGYMLYEVLEKILAVQNILNLNACIACSEKEDEYLKKDSIIFHEHIGYMLAGKFNKCGYKFNRWYDIIWMEKHIGNHTENQPEVKSFEEVKEVIKNKYGIE